jgi:D-glycero-D-manno-heptose 1,7-bisphosphate phosphatase
MDMNKNIAVFLDRDGTINEEVGYLRRIEDLRLIPHTAEAVRLINKNGMKAVVISNQSGVARGFFSETFVGTVHARLDEMLQQEGAVIDGFYFCPHHPTEGDEPYRTVCSCRKPEPGMLLKAAAELNIDLTQSYVVGDMPKDIHAADRVGAKGILVKTGYSKDADASIAPAYVAEDLLDAVQWILKDRAG